MESDIDSTILKVDINSVAELLDIKPQKLRHRLNLAGIEITEDGILGREDMQLGLLLIDIDWEEILPKVIIESYEDTKATQEESTQIYRNLIEFELDNVNEILKTPGDNEEIIRTTNFLHSNEIFELEARVFAGALTAIDEGLISSLNNLDTFYKIKYSISKSKELMKKGDYQHASELAFAGIACDPELGKIEVNDERLILYFAGLLVENGALSEQAIYEFNVNELIWVGLKSERVIVIENIHLALIRAIYLNENFIARMKLSREVRVELRKSFNILREKFGLPEDLMGIELDRLLAKEITRTIGELIRAGESFLSNQGNEHINLHRSRLIPRLKNIIPFSTTGEQQIIDGAIPILTSRLTDLFKERESGDITEYRNSYNATITNIENLENQARANPSWITTCIIYPIMKWLRVCLISDYKDRTSTYTAIIDLRLSKKEYPLQVGEKQNLELVATNNGNSSAENINIQFILIDAVSISQPKIPIGNINTGTSSSELLLELTVLEERNVYDIPYQLSWSNLNGETSHLSSSLKILPQKKIDWELLRRKHPYSISSIKENQPEKLKGRTDKLTALRMGLDSSQSFFITGQKRVGKSSIANVYFGELLKLNKILPIHFLIGDVADCDLYMLGEALCKYVQDAWNYKNHSDLPFPIPPKERFQQSFSFTFSEFLKSFHRHLSDWKIVFIIDDFDEIREDMYKGDTGDTFFRTLRGFIDRDYTSFIIIGSEYLTTTILHEHHRIINQADTLEVDYLDHRKDLEELITEPIGEFLFFDQESISEIIDLSSGNPYYANLICSRIYRLMVDEEDYYIARTNVRRASELLALEDRQKSYEHFWTDGIRDIGPEKERVAYNNAMTIIALSKGEIDSSRYVDIRTAFQQPEVHHMETAELEYRLNELADRKVIERSPKSASHFRIKVKQFSLWLKEGGAHQIRQNYGQYEYTIRPMKDHALFPEEIVQVTNGLEYRGENIDRILVETWLRQFGDEYNQRLAYKTLCALKEHGYYSIEKFNLSLETMLKIAIGKTSGWAKVVDEKGKLTRNILVTWIDPDGKSGPEIVTEFRRVNQIYFKLSGTLEAITDILSGNSDISKTRKEDDRWLLMIVDDFVGTGGNGSGYLSDALENLDQQCPGWEKICNPFYAFINGFEKGAQAIENATDGRVPVFVVNPLEEKDRAFSKEADIFEDDRERHIAKSLFQKIGSSLEKKGPLGFGDSQALVVLPFNVPNNTLPVFYKQGKYDGKIWTPLFPRV